MGNSPNELHLGPRISESVKSFGFERNFEKRLKPIEVNKLLLGPVRLEMRVIEVAQTVLHLPKRVFEAKKISQESLNLY